MDREFYQKELAKAKKDLGDKAELGFEDVMRKHGFLVDKTTLSEDRRHIDYYLSHKNWGNRMKVDVKSRKRTSRHNTNFNDEWIWVEFKNVWGQKGWLYGEEDLIAFERPDDYVLVTRKSLAKLCEKLVDMNSLVHRSYEAKYKLYKRKQGDDRISQIKMADILTLHSAILKK